MFWCCTSINKFNAHNGFFYSDPINRTINSKLSNKAVSWQRWVITGFSPRPQK